MRRNDDEIQLLVNRISSLDAALTSLVKEITFVVKPDDKCIDFMDALRTTVEPEMGSVKVEIGFLVQPEQMVIADIAHSLSWNLRTDSFAKLRGHPAVQDVLIKAPDVVAPPPRWQRKS